MARTSTEGVTLAAGEERICPRCGRTLLAESVRCRFCLLDVREVEAQAVDPVAADTGRRLRLPQIRHRWTRRRGFVIVFAVIVLVLVSRHVYDNWIWTPPPLPSPASTAISLTMSPRTWPVPNGGIDGARTTSASAAIDGAEAWTVDLGADVLRPPVAGEERLYVTLRDSIVALALDDGRELWRVERPGLLSAPAVVGSRLYVALRTGDVVALDVEDGSIVWSASLDQELFTTPTPFAGVLYVYAPGRVYGIDAENGRRLWDRGVESNRAELPVVLNEEYFVVAALSAVLIYDRETGERTFSHPHTSTAGLIIDDDFAYSISPGFAAGIDLTSKLPWWEGTRLYWNWLWALGAAPQPPRPEVDWISRERPSNVRSGAGLSLTFRPAFDGERIVTSDTTGLVRAFDAATGELSWETQLESLHGPPTFTADGLVVPQREAVGVLDPASGAWLEGRSLDTLNLRVKRWVIVLEQGTFVVDGPGTVLALR